MIFRFSRSCDFLSDYIRRLPKRGFGEAKKMAAHLRVSSTYLRQVSSGAKVLTPEQTILLASYLGLTSLESDYFLLLIQKERAGTRELEDYFARKQDELKSKALQLVNHIQPKSVLTDIEKSVFYSNAIYSAVHLYCATHKKGRDVEEIAQRFNISRTKARKVMAFLTEASLCLEDKGRCVIGTQSIHLEQGSPHLLQHYANWRLRAVQASENLTDQELMYTLNIAISEKDFGVLREKTMEFIKKFLEQAYPSPSEEIACLNIDWFRIRN